MRVRTLVISYLLYILAGLLVVRHRQKRKK